mmetsp:Transcript_7407/g.24430  ORF Transcript_7407/g.24430 Transcript_7407/m.24430 type:complete len:195 (+) Transcript_7407:189-773(+)
MNKKERSRRRREKKKEKGKKKGRRKGGEKRGEEEEREEEREEGKEKANRGLFWNVAVPPRNPQPVRPAATPRGVTLHLFTSRFRLRSVVSTATGGGRPWSDTSFWFVGGIGIVATAGSCRSWTGRTSEARSAATEISSDVPPNTEGRTASAGPSPASSRRCWLAQRNYRLKPISESGLFICARSKSGADMGRVF